LFSTFPRGLPGAGLLLLRAAVVVPLIHAGMLTMFLPSPGIADLVMGGLACLLMIGLWTPIAASLLSLTAFGRAWSHPAEPWTLVQLGVLSAALAMLGPGGASVDARLFGRKRIEIPER
jgi:uncharacterized membrane protein YphA (DoxX/SURF4 family)